MMKGKTILVIDDEEDISNSLELALDMEGYKVHIAYNGQQAFDLLEKGLAPDLIITDMMMPVMDGYVFFNQLKQKPEFKDIPVMLMSAGRLDEARLNQQEYDGFIKKPFDLYKFMDAVQATIDKVST